MSQPCPDCGQPVLLTRDRVLDAVGTPTGPFCRLGWRRHPNDIATSRYYSRSDGFWPHRCPQIGARP